MTERHLRDRHLYLGSRLLPAAQSVSEDPVGAEMATWLFTDGISGSIKAWLDSSGKPGIDVFMRFHAMIPPDWRHSESDRLGRIR